MFRPEEVVSMLRTLNDVPVFGPDFIYAVGEAPDSTDVVLREAAELSLTDGMIPIGVPGWDHDRFGYPGCSVYKTKLQALGIPEELVVTIPPVTEIAGNTRTEAEAFALYVEQQGFKKVVVVAPTIHQPRAFLTMLQAVLERNVQVSLYNAVAWQPWSDVPMTHSQGVVSGTMDELIMGEMVRIRKYHDNSGHVALGQPVLDYFRNRK